MGRTISSFRIVLAMEEERGWKTFHNTLEGSDKRKFDEMFDIHRFYLTMLSYALQSVRLYPILISLMLYGYQQLSDCILQVKQMIVKIERIE
jgi:hypothetical protein